MLQRVSWSDRLLKGGRRNMLDLKEALSLLLARPLLATDNQCSSVYEGVLFCACFVQRFFCIAHR